jgi:hypothetical protein
MQTTLAVAAQPVNASVQIAGIAAAAHPAIGHCDAPVLRQAVGVHWLIDEGLVDGGARR